MKEHKEGLLVKIVQEFRIVNNCDYQDIKSVFDYIGLIKTNSELHGY